jgi:hypothetical protein
VADAHTQAAIARMNAAVSAAGLSAATTDITAFHALGNALSAEVEALVAGCTMRGPSHDRLHVWLGELLPGVQTLVDSADLGSLRSAHQAVTAQLAAFPRLFPSGKGP